MAINSKKTGAGATKVFAPNGAKAAGATRPTNALRSKALKEAEAVPMRSPAPTGEGLDRIDRAILRTLQKDASVSNVALAAKVNLSAPACLRRVERLKETGMVKGIVALLDPRPLGAGMLVVIGVVLDRSTPESFADFERAAQKVSGCMECHVVTGEFDYFMMLRTKDSESFNRLHAEQLLYLPAVRQIRSFMVLKEVLSTTQFPI